MTSRWWIYQRERFPLLAVVPLTALVGWSAVSYSGLLRGGEGRPSAKAALVAMASTFLFFWQLRVADEFKDASDDLQHRSGLPVPRGLVNLRELGWLAAASAAAHMVLALWLNTRMLLVLATVWCYMAFMTREFFVAEWLKARRLAYVLSHMLVIPLAVFYASSADWLPAAAAPPPDLAWLLALSYATGMVLELGRKVRAPQDETPGVETYSAAWGPRTAAAAWLGAVAVSALLTLVVVRAVAWPMVAGAVLLLPGLAAAWAGAAFCRLPSALLSRRIDALSALWTLSVYLCVGSLPLWRAWAVPVVESP